jgi:DNA end-binding protein Ku
LRETLRTTSRAAVGRVAIRERQALAVVHARKDLLVLHTAHWPDEIRDPDFPLRSVGVAVDADELAAARALVEAMSGRLNPAELTDNAAGSYAR